MRANLSFEQTPSISVPFRFFLTAPLFGVAAGLLLAVLGPSALESRWTPGAFALTHLIAAGYMLQSMCGALLQFVPVAAGGNVWRPGWIAAIVHPLVLAAALALVLAFLVGWSLLFALAAMLFAAGLGVFLLAVLSALLRVSAKGMSLQTLRLSLLGLSATLAGGVTLALTLGGFIGNASLLDVLNVHVAWGLGGWSLMLVIGVSYLVVPMFQLTAPYPPRLARLLPWTLFCLLCMASLPLIGLEAPFWTVWATGGGVALAAVYAAVTLRLQAGRRRKVADGTLVLWRGAMVSLLALALFWIGMTVWPDLAAHPRAPLGIGVLALVGVFVSAINSMLYKIVPFLSWLHLQRSVGLKAAPPTMRQMIPEAAMRGQWRLHFAALALLLLALIWPVLTIPAGLAFAASCLWLEWNLVGAVRMYRRNLPQIAGNSGSMPK